MHTEKFTASTQYSDLKGSAAADDADRIGPWKWLTQKGLLQEGEYIVGISMYAGESHGAHRDPVSVTFYVAPPENANRRLHVPGGDAVPTVVRQVRIDMPLHEFFALFKRFHVCLSPKGEFDGHLLSYPNY